MVSGVKNMRTRILNVVYDHKIEVGSCVVQCFELLFKYFGYDICSYTILGMSECFDVRYRKMNLKKRDLSEVAINRSWHIEKFLNEKSPFNIQRKHFEKFDMAINYLYDSIDKEIPVCVGLNSYHVTYCKDYHKNFGGLFKSYHMVIVNGYDKEKMEIYVVDPALEVSFGVIKFDDFALAWNEPRGINREYDSYTYFKFLPKEESDFEPKRYTCMLNEAIDNFRNYYNTTMVDRIGRFIKDAFVIEVDVAYDAKFVCDSAEFMDVKNVYRCKSI